MSVPMPVHVPVCHCNHLECTSFAPTVTAKPGTVDPEFVLQSTPECYQWQRRVDLLRHLALLAASVDALAVDAAAAAAKRMLWLRVCLAEALSQMACAELAPEASLSLAALDAVVNNKEAEITNWLPRKEGRRAVARLGEAMQFSASHGANRGLQPRGFSGTANVDGIHK